MGGTIESVIVARVEKKTGMIVESAVFAGTDHEEQNKRAENHFKFLCGQYLSNWDDYTAEDVETCIENGVAESGKNIIQITHPEDTLICPTHEDEGKNDGFDPIKDGVIFIVAPNGQNPEDHIHKVCRSKVAGDLFTDIYPNDKYDELGDRMSLATAKKLAAKHGCKRPRVI